MLVELRIAREGATGGYLIAESVLLTPPLSIVHELRPQGQGARAMAATRHAPGGTIDKTAWECERLRWRQLQAL